MTSVKITDHAVLRYLERACGVNVEALRRRIARRAALPCPAPRSIDAHALVHEGLKYHFRSDGDGMVTLVTVTAVGDGQISKRAQRLRRRQG